MVGETVLEAPDNKGAHTQVGEEDPFLSPLSPDLVMLKGPQWQ